MTRTKLRIAALLAMPAIMAGAAAAQNPTPEQAAPTIRLVHPGANQLYKDLDYVLGLTTPTEQKQLPCIKEFGLDIFLLGVDHSQPVRVDALTGGPAIRYLTFIPIADLQEFRDDNLDDASIRSKRVGGPTLFRLEFVDDTGTEPLGFMRLAHGYAAISPKRADLPSSIPDPRPAIEELVAKYDLALDIRNAQTSPAAIQVRRQAYAGNIHKELFGMLQQAENETEIQFEFRKLITDISLDELGRVYADARHARLGLVIEETEKQPTWLDIDVDPLPDTELAASVQLLAQKPSAFANIARTENAILSARVNHPLDEMRQKNFLRLFKFFRDQAKQDLDADQTATAAEKGKRKQAADLFFDMFDEGIKRGVLDAFAESHPNESGKNTVLGSILAVDGNDLIPALELFPKTSQGQKVELNVDEAGPVKIHKFTAATKDDPLFNDFLGSDVVYVGTTKESVWYAAGENALEELKAAILKTAEPNTGKADDPPVDLLVKMGPWMKLRQAMRAGAGDPKETLELRQMAVDAFSQSDDKLMLKLNRKEDRITGLMSGQPGILRLVGKILADFSRKNFDDTQDKGLAAPGG